jgi:HAE1 family hydrophobic/amphiphilic exporter-1
MQPLGIVVIGGLLIGTLVTLVLVPAVYCLVYRLSAKFPEGKKRGKGGKTDMKDSAETVVKGDEKTI